MRALITALMLWKTWLYIESLKLLLSALGIDCPSSIVDCTGERFLACVKLPYFSRGQSSLPSLVLSSATTVSNEFEAPHHIFIQLSGLLFCSYLHSATPWPDRNHKNPSGQGCHYDTLNLWLPERRCFEALGSTGWLQLSGRHPAWDLGLLPNNRDLAYRLWTWSLLLRRRPMQDGMWSRKPKKQSEGYNMDMVRALASFVIRDNMLTCISPVQKQTMTQMRDTAPRRP